MDLSGLVGQTFEEADDRLNYRENKTPLERLNGACFIINNMYNGTGQTKVDKKFVSVKKHGDG